MIQDKWIPFKQVDFTDKTILQYHIDTRDFHCLRQTDKPENLPDLDKLDKYGDSFYYSDEEIKNLIERYFNQSGGKRDWRFFFIKGLGETWDLKYIRIYRTDKGMLVCTRDNRAIRKDITASEGANSQYC